MRDVVTHIASAGVAAVAFWWRWESTQKRWTKERFSVLAVTALAVLWNLYMAWWKWKS